MIKTSLTATTTLLLALLCALLTAGGTGCSPADQISSEALVARCHPLSQYSCSCSDGQVSTAVCRSDGSALGVCACGGTAGAAGSGVPTTPPSAPAPGNSDGLSCDVARILKASCLNCHGATPQFGAPMSLASAAMFRTGSVGQQVLGRIADDTKPMPPQPYARLTDAEKQTLKTWIAQGAPDQTCAAASGAPASTSPSARAPAPGSQCYSMVARASASGTKFNVPTTPDLYQCFTFSAPWGDKRVQIVSAHPIIDNAKVIHHWILYNNSGKVTDGANSGCSGAHPDAAQLVGWAPGGQDLALPEDVGLHVDNGGFTLEVHYNNQAAAGQQDASGAQICVTDQLRKNEAAVHWLGTQNLNKLSATGMCTPTGTVPVTVLSSTPHMHLQGRHLKTVINRASGGTELLIDTPFDFQTQISYPTRATVNPGDTLSTTCTFAAPTPFGQGTNQEMCYNFVIAYPAGGLAQSFQLLRKNDCTGF